jgi:MEMO1 family protein
MEKNKYPNVAGQFYTSNPNQLKKEIESYLDLANNYSHLTQPLALIAPHAGHLYSGAIAATAYKSLLPFKSNIKKVAVLSPSHFFSFQGIALLDKDFYLTPLGKIKIDQKMNSKLLTLDSVGFLEDVFEKEHALEVHLPFIQSVLEDFELIPIIINAIEPEVIANIIRFLMDEGVFIIVSSDMSHFHNYQLAQELDQQTSSHILKMEYQQIKPEDACGYYPLKGLLYLAKQKNLQITELDLRNSGDTAGDKSRVVGYGAFSFSCKT